MIYVRNIIGKFFPSWQLLLISFLMYAACKQPKQNRLASASSPYLLEHADNPVDWYEWGDAALEKSKKENKPLLISIGYSACHWCHVMEEESFMDTAVARLMNENFICIKIDREERPDIDNIYLAACQLVTGSAGWPLHAFALPDGKPFFAGTYYTKQSWMSLLKQISTAYHKQNKMVALQARALANGIFKPEIDLQTDTNSTAISTNAYHLFFDSLLLKLDTLNGGLKGAPKFPTSTINAFLLQYSSITNNPIALNAATNSLTKMALGGIYDQIGGGFARYSVDSLWRIPHFEKMLYDNAQLLSLYAQAYQITGNSFFKTIATETAAFVQTVLTARGGGFYSSVNAVTAAGEGEYYAWTWNEIADVVKQDDNPFSTYFGVTKTGNWQGGKNILAAELQPKEFALKNRFDTSAFEAGLKSFKKRALEIRKKRPQPTVDQKILTSWNALMITGFLDAFAAIGDPSYLNQALECARFLEKNIIQSNGNLWRGYTKDKVSIPGLLEDYAFLSDAFIRLYVLTLDKHWLNLSQQLAAQAIKNFYDPKVGMFYTSLPAVAPLGVNKFELADNALPSSNAIMAKLLYNLGVYFQNDDYLAKSSAMVSKIAGNSIQADQRFYASWYTTASYFAFGIKEVAIIGKDAVTKTRLMQERFLPLAFFMGSEGEEHLPLLKGKLKQDNTFIYVCTNKTCKKPTDSVTEALLLLETGY